jgi:hypothetical protein
MRYCYGSDDTCDIVLIYFGDSHHCVLQNASSQNNIDHTYVQQHKRIRRMGLSNTTQQKMRAILIYIEKAVYARVSMDLNDDIHVACSNKLCVVVRAS